MSSFDYNAKSNKRWRIWFFTALGGVLNLLILIVLDIYLSVDLQNNQ